MKEYLTTVITPLITTPQVLEIIETEEEANTKVYTLTVDKKDMGRLLGKSGETISAIRTLARHLGGKVGEKVFVRVNEP